MAEDAMIPDALQRLQNERFTLKSWDGKPVFERQEGRGAWVPWEAIERVLATVPVEGPEPQIDCPLCGVTVKQVSSATLSLALWQHVNLVCMEWRRPAAEGRAPEPPKVVYDIPVDQNQTASLRVEMPAAVEARAPHAPPDSFMAQKMSGEWIRCVEASRPALPLDWQPMQPFAEKACKAAKGIYLCSEPLGHSGVHVARGLQNQVYDTWPDPPADAPPAAHAAPTEPE